MQIINLYKYNTDNGYIITPKKQNENNNAYMYRIIADDDKILKHNDTTTKCVDIYPTELNLWAEIKEGNTNEENKL